MARAQKRPARPALSSGSSQRRCVAQRDGSRNTAAAVTASEVVGASSPAENFLPSTPAAEPSPSNRAVVTSVQVTPGVGPAGIHQGASQSPPAAETARAEDDGGAYAARAVALSVLRDAVRPPASDTTTTKAATAPSSPAPAGGAANARRPNNLEVQPTAGTARPPSPAATSTRPPFSPTSTSAPSSAPTTPQGSSSLADALNLGTRLLHLQLVAVSKNVDNVPETVRDILVRVEHRSRGQELLATAVTTLPGVLTVGLKDFSNTN